uniref:Uncharacterized protein n=1 Tax=Anguilla anguilla TaxID=7936 RepID=A0A0E9TEE5_ANGAN
MMKKSMMGCCLLWHNNTKEECKR